MVADRYVPNGRPLTPYEREIFGCVQEECAEIIVAISKLLRFGAENRPADGVPNTVVLAREIGDLHATLERAMATGLIDPDELDSALAKKHERLDFYLQHQGDDR